MTSLIQHSPTGYALGAKPISTTTLGVATPEDRSFGIGDIIDAVNPLQQLPIVSTFYRQMTGDSIGSVARLAGGALLGGPIGLAAAAVNVFMAETTGKDMGAQALAMINGSAARTDAVPTIETDGAIISSLGDQPGKATTPAEAMAVYANGAITALRRSDLESGTEEKTDLAQLMKPERMAMTRESIIQRMANQMAASIGPPGAKEKHSILA